MYDVDGDVADANDDDHNVFMMLKNGAGFQCDGVSYALAASANCGHCEHCHEAAVNEAIVCFLSCTG